MQDPNIDPSPAELALIEAELPEWERLAVRDYWDAVLAEEMAELPMSVEPLNTRGFRVEQGQQCARRVRNIGTAAVLRLVVGDKTPVSTSDNEAA